jgi:beta-phosphoglucomutase-like phosphatase (HAD superfamily)
MTRVTHNLPSLAAVLFDFDGTLVDTMPSHFAAYREVFSEAGLELTESDFFANVGGKASETIPKFLRGRRIDMSNEEIHRRKKAKINTVFATAPVHVLPAASLLPLFSGAVPLGLVSAGSRPGIEILLKRLGWSDYFDVVITGEDCVRSKPDPDPFVTAAMRLSVDASRVLVFEDTSAGFDAALAAGMMVFDVSKNRSYTVA